MARRRGRRHAFDIIDPTRTVLVVIDLLQSYVDGTPCAASILPAVARLADCLRETGGLVAWVFRQPDLQSALGG